MEGSGHKGMGLRAAPQDENRDAAPEKRVTTQTEPSRGEPSRTSLSLSPFLSATDLQRISHQQHGAEEETEGKE